MRRPVGALGWAELAAALLSTVVFVVLSVRFATEAGPLWRDEVSSLQLATRPAYADVLRSLSLDSAPALYPTLLRGWASSWGADEDGVLRMFGLGVATAVVGAVWLTGWMLGTGPPLLAVTLIGAHVATLTTLATLKPYGLGCLFIVLVLGAVGQLSLSAGRRPLLLALAFAVLAVQSLYQNAPLIVAICVAGLTVAALARQRSTALAVVAIGLAAAVSLLPYAGVLLSSRHWRAINTIDLDTLWLLYLTGQNLIEGNWGLVVLWVGAAALMSCGVALALRGISSRQPEASERVVLYAALVIACAAALYLGFLKLASRPPLGWHYVPLVGVLAVAIDAATGRTRALRWVRLAVVLLGATLAFPTSADRVGVRQTNIDLVAQHLHTTARRGDLIILNPWYLGITFNRYYRGPVEWMTLPPIEDLTVHRYDLLKARMASPEPLAALYGAIQSALESGHRVWVVGGLPILPWGQLPLVVPIAPGSPTGWRDGPYSTAWSQQVGYFVQTRADRYAFIGIPVDRPVNAFEHVPLEVIDGWRQRSAPEPSAALSHRPSSPR